MEIALKIISSLTCLIGVIVLFAAIQKRFKHFGMTIAGLTYFISGILSLYYNIWWPAITGIIVAVVIRKKFGEPDYSDKNTFQLWLETFKPLIADNGEPLNYKEVIHQFTDMTIEEKNAYIKGKTNKNLLWSVVDNGNNNLIAKPGLHEKNVVA